MSSPAFDTSDVSGSTQPSISSRITTSSRAPNTSSDSNYSISASATGSILVTEPKHHHKTGGNNNHNSSTSGKQHCTLDANGNVVPSLYVIGLPNDFTTEQFVAAFSEFGEIKSARVMRSREVPLPPNRSFAFVQFQNLDGASKALQQGHGLDLGADSKIQVFVQRSREETAAANPKVYTAGEGFTAPRPAFRRQGGNNSHDATAHNTTRGGSDTMSHPSHHSAAPVVIQGSQYQPSFPTVHSPLPQQPGVLPFTYSNAFAMPGQPFAPLGVPLPAGQTTPTAFPWASSMAFVPQPFVHPAMLHTAYMPPTFSVPSGGSATTSAPYHPSPF